MGETATREDRPLQEISGPARASAAAILGTDFPGMRPRFEVAEGDRVGCGQLLFRDRKHPQIAFVAPISGRVATLQHGPRRTLSLVVIEAGDAGAGAVAPDVPDRGRVRQELLARGFWPAFRSRPFGHMPHPEARPSAIVVNAVRKTPQAPDPAGVLAAQQADFNDGLDCLTQLTDGQVFVCQSPGDPLAAVTGRITCAAFSGTRAAGFAGTQIDHLCPPTPGGEVWTIGYQDVAAIGQLFRTGIYASERVVSVSGRHVGQPRRLRAVLGLRLADVAERDAGVALSGDALTGHPAAYLSRFDDQITQVAQRRAGPGASWLRRLGGRTDALIPNRALDRALAVNIPTVPLLRALASGDAEEAARLGCLALVEEDVAALSRRCTSGADYPRLLRQVLDTLGKDAA